ncbi:MAG TPA: Rieske (2Fe-2S) protein [Thermoguttaceae bacterium]|nr:Rieske (2Fe-2S) protein [Thermoguttaceae bacterium]
MEITPHPPCCDSPPCAAVEDRRGFLASTIAVVLGTVALLVPAILGIVSFFNPLRQKSTIRGFRKVTMLDVLPEDGMPRKFPVMADLVDAWNKLPNQPIGAVFLRRTGKDQVEAINVICPHAGCAVQYADSPEGGKYFCPCHSASFNINGTCLDESSPSPRPLDKLDVDLEKLQTTGEVWVDFKNFKTGIAGQEELA